MILRSQARGVLMSDGRPPQAAGWRRLSASAELLIDPECQSRDIVRHTSSPLEKLLAVLTDGWTGDTEEHENGTIQSHDVLIGEPAHIAADPRLSK